MTDNKTADDDDLQKSAEFTIHSWLFRAYNEAISECEKEHGDQRDRSEILEENKELNELVEVLLPLLSKLKWQVYKLEEWIPVSERLPEERQEIVAVDKVTRRKKCLTFTKQGAVEQYLRLYFDYWIPIPHFSKPPEAK